MIDVRVQSADFDEGRQLARLAELKRAATASFVARLEAADDVESIWIDHHGPMARRELGRIAEEATERWSLAGIILIHRQGSIAPCGRVLFVGVVASEVEASNVACSWIVEQTLQRGPFWRKDILADGTSRWR